MSEYGTVVNVAVVTLGAITSADAASAATTITVEDNVDLDPGSGLVITDADGLLFGTNQVVSVSGEDTVVLATPLSGALAAGARLDLYPSQKQSLAAVRLASGGEPIRCTVRHDLADTFALVEGVRDESTAETVLVEKVGDDYQIVEVVSSPTLRRIIGGYIATSDDEEIQRIVIRDDGNGGIFEFFSGSQYEDGPGYINPGVDHLGGSDQGYLLLASPHTNSGGPGTIRIYSASSVGDDGSIVLTANKVVNAAGKLHCVGAEAVSGVGLEVDGYIKLGYGFNNDAHFAQDVYLDAIPTGGTVANVFMGTLGRLTKITSTRRHKYDEELADLDIDAFLQVPTKTYRRYDDPSYDQIQPETGRVYTGAIAEDLHDLGLTSAVTYDEGGDPDGIDWSVMTMHLLETVKQLSARIADLEETR